LAKRSDLGLISHRTARLTELDTLKGPGRAGSEVNRAGELIGSLSLIVVVYIRDQINDKNCEKPKIDDRVLL
jgi:hypothetical protein